jgi:hypothetical protein
MLALVGLAGTACVPSTPSAPSTPPVSTVPHGATGKGPIITGFTCPVNNSTYRDDFGPRGTRWHYGIDMMVGAGNWLFAVKAGKVRNVPNEGAGGNVVYLTGNDGNVYMYAHLLSFKGTNRTVTRGEVIGYVGQSGNATAPHVHFEIRINGINGTRVDPYNTLQASSCQKRTTATSTTRALGSSSTPVPTVAAPKPPTQTTTPATSSMPSPVSAPVTVGNTTMTVTVPPLPPVAGAVTDAVDQTLTQP